MWRKIIDDQKSGSLTVTLATYWVTTGALDSSVVFKLDNFTNVD